MVFTDNILAYCEKNGIKEADFEKRCNLSKGMIAKWKSGVNQTPSVVTLMKIETATGISCSRWLRKGAIHGKRQATANHPEN